MAVGKNCTNVPHIVEKIMCQAQVFASAWSLIGSVFDQGYCLDEAENAKAELKSMVVAAVTPPHTDSNHYEDVELLVQTAWVNDVRSHLEASNDPEAKRLLAYLKVRLVSLPDDIKPA